MTKEINFIAFKIELTESTIQVSVINKQKKRRIYSFKFK